MSIDKVLDYFDDWYTKLSKNKQVNSHWLDLFNFWLDFMGKNLDKMSEIKETYNRLLDKMNENPQIIETIIEKSMKHWVQSNYNNWAKLCSTSLQMLRKLRNLTVRL